MATLAASIGLGAVAAYAVQRLMDYLRASQSGALPGASALAGAGFAATVHPGGQEAPPVVVLPRGHADKCTELPGADGLHGLAAGLHLGAAESHRLELAHRLEQPRQPQRGSDRR